MASKHNRTGRTKGKGQFVPIPYPMAKSLAWRSLSGPAAKIFIELRARYNGRNNGDLSLSYGEAATLLHLGKTTVKRAYDELTEKGFIVKTSKGHWYGRKAATWATTDNVVDVPGAGIATNAWKSWFSPSKKTKAGTQTERKAP